MLGGGVDLRRRLRQLAANHRQRVRRRAGRIDRQRQVRDAAKRMIGNDRARHPRHKDLRPALADDGSLSDRWLTPLAKRPPKMPETSTPTPPPGRFGVPQARRPNRPLANDPAPTGFRPYTARDPTHPT